MPTGRREAPPDDRLRMVEGAACFKDDRFSSTTALRAVPLSCFAREDKPTTRQRDLDRLGRVVAENVDHFGDDHIVARVGVCVHISSNGALSLCVR